MGGKKPDIVIGPDKAIQKATQHSKSKSNGKTRRLTVENVEI